VRPKLGIRGVIPTYTADTFFMFQCLITHIDDSTVCLQAMSLTSMQHTTYKISKFPAEKQLNMHVPNTVSAANDVTYRELSCLNKNSHSLV
jgi:hypothetical protein